MPAGGLRCCTTATGTYTDWKDLGFRVVSRDGEQIWQWYCRTCRRMLGELPYNPPGDVPAA